ncbi:MAG: MotE family protein [Nitratireductor sp.]|nr:MotE family protein [Nitratireductor sp.]
MANADLPKSDMPGAVADAGMIDADIITGAVMNEKDMLQYCVNVSDEAREARYALIKAKLDETEAEVDQKLVSLEKKLKAVREYVEIRKEFQAAAEAQVVSIFGTMRPDAAAQQIARLDVRLAAAIIMKLDPKVSSIILAEMRPKAAATLAGFISASMMSEEKVGTDQ